MDGSYKSKNWSKFKIIGLRALAVIGIICLLPILLVIAGPALIIGLSYESLLIRLYISILF